MFLSKVSLMLKVVLVLMVCKAHKIFKIRFLFILFILFIYFFFWGVGVVLLYNKLNMFVSEFAADRVCVWISIGVHQAFGNTILLHYALLPFNSVVGSESSSSPRSSHVRYSFLYTIGVKTF